MLVSRWPHECGSWHLSHITITQLEFSQQCLYLQKCNLYSAVVKIISEAVFVFHLSDICFSLFCSVSHCMVIYFVQTGWWVGVGSWQVSSPHMQMFMVSGLFVWSGSVAMAACKHLQASKPTCCVRWQTYLPSVPSNNILFFEGMQLSQIKRSTCTIYIQEGNINISI